MIPVKSSEYDIILFDLDGTLTDSKLGLTKAIQYALSKYNIIEDNLSMLESFIGPPIKESLKKFYSFDEDTAWEAVGYYREYLEQAGYYENSVYPGIVELLKLLKGRNKELVVATSKLTQSAEKVLKHFGLSDYFVLVEGCFADGTRVSKVDIIRDILLRLPNVRKESIVMVGDRDHDIVGAHKNGIDSIAVTYGYGTIEELQNANPTYIVESVLQLKSLLIR